MLREEFLVPMELTAGKIAKACGITRSRIERIVAEDLGISGDTAIRLGAVFGTSPELWMNLQMRYELQAAQIAMGDAVAQIQALSAA